MLGQSDPKFPLPPCRVCDAPGTGFHYGVNTCEACKGFFHRSLKQWTKYKCLNKRNCVIQHGSGILCRLCRYQRCLVMGMSKAAIKTGRYNYKKKTDDILEVKQIRAKQQATVIPGDISQQHYGDIDLDNPAHHSLGSPAERRGSPSSGFLPGVMVKREVNEDALDLSQLQIGSFDSSRSTTTCVAKGFRGDDSTRNNNNNNNNDHAHHMFYDNAVVTKTEHDVDNDSDDNSDVQMITEDGRPALHSFSRQKQENYYPALMSVLANPNKELDLSNNNKNNNNNIRVTEFPAAHSSPSPPPSSSFPSSSISSPSRRKTTSFGEYENYSFTHSVPAASPSSSSSPTHPSRAAISSSPLLREQLDEGYSSSNTPPSASVLMGVDRDNGIIINDDTPSQQMPALCYIPTTNRNEMRSSSSSSSSHKRSYTWRHSDDEECTPAKLPSPLRIPSLNDNYYYHHQSGPTTTATSSKSTTTTTSVGYDVKDEHGVVFKSNDNIPLDYIKGEDHVSGTSYAAGINTSHAPSSDWLFRLIRNNPIEKVNEVLKATKHEVSEIDAVFSDTKTVLRQLVIANDKFVQPYFQEVSKEETNKQRGDERERLSKGNGGDDSHENSNDDLQATMSDFAKTMEDTIRVMVSFAMVIPGFEGLPKNLKIDLIKNSRQEFCLLNLFKCAGPNTRLGSISKDKGQHSGVSEFHEYRMCLSSIFGFMEELQRLDLTHEECVVLRALAIMAPDRLTPTNPTNSLVLTAIYDQLVNLLIHLLNKRLASPMPFFARLTSFITECRAKEEELTSKFRKFNVESSLLLRDKPFLKLMFSGIYS